MATVTGMTAEKIIELTDDALVSVAIDDETGVMTLMTRGGQTLTAGNVDLSKKAVDLAYPVGSLYFSSVATNPATLFGVGTWAAFGTGKTLIGVDPADTDFDAPNKTGGAKRVALAANEVPRHTHDLSNHTHGMGNHVHGTPPHNHTLEFQYRNEAQMGAGNTVVTDIQGQTAGYGSVGNGTTTTAAPTTYGPSTNTTDGPSNNSSGAAFGNGSGGTDSHQNLPPYVTCYIWKRTA